MWDLKGPQRDISSENESWVLALSRRNTYTKHDRDRFNNQTYSSAKRKINPHEVRAKCENSLF